MATYIQVSGRTVNIENVTHALNQGDALVIFPAGYYQLRLTGEEARQAKARMIEAGFVCSGETIINPSRFVIAEEAGSVARLMLDGAQKMVVVPKQFTECILGADLPKSSEPVEEVSGEKETVEAVSSAGNAKRRTKKGGA